MKTWMIIVLAIYGCLNLLISLIRFKSCSSRLTKAIDVYRLRSWIFKNSWSNSFLLTKIIIVMSNIIFFPSTIISNIIVSIIQLAGII